MTQMTPSQIVKFLDQHVVGQDDAKKQLAVAVYAHFKKIALARADSSEIVKSNVLLIGPTGTGKTLLCETLSKALGVPFVTANATSLAQSEFVNEEIEAMLQRLIDKAGGDIERAQRGIVFIDEIDKLKAISGQSKSAAGESVQHALLKIMESAPVKLKSAQHIDTTHILFICGGAFVGLSEILAKSHSFGFISTADDDNQKVLDRLNARVKPTDLFEYGLIPEFAGRLPIVARLEPLSRETLIRIMVEPRNSIFNQFREILKNEGVELKIDALVFEQIADLAMEYKVGARSLRGIFEELLTPAMYLVPDHPEVRQVVFSSLFENARFLGAPASQAGTGKTA
ncbi:MAG: AAA family ATPase [Gammaproteobacteria bacterium]|nr:AAA family ATPase [Rhodocyclaceae bacterium]MBU3909210.1 AAA family ATPase [Gammaproteobacteria bacterium]MBU3990150.1 AAA family ATPase [Gammaproteobacteria bacterium]MBU4005630.1 AAA family ATPase [Gammaproteobacteria bacterium]MBU4020817.1 AAA family ATPase [Gammaproteobacteria bacterium]